MAGERTQEKRTRHPATSKPAASFTLGAWPCGCSLNVMAEGKDALGPSCALPLDVPQRLERLQEQLLHVARRSHVSPSPDSDPSCQGSTAPQRCETPRGGGYTGRPFYAMMFGLWSHESVPLKLQQVPLSQGLWAAAFSSNKDSEMCFCCHLLSAVGTTQGVLDGEESLASHSSTTLPTSRRK